MAYSVIMPHTDSKLIGQSLSVVCPLVSIHHGLLIVPSLLLVKYFLRRNHVPLQLIYNNNVIKNNNKILMTSFCSSDFWEQDVHSLSGRSSVPVEQGQGEYGGCSLQCGVTSGLLVPHRRGHCACRGQVPHHVWPWCIQRQGNSNGWFLFFFFFQFFRTINDWCAFVALCKLFYHIVVLVVSFNLPLSSSVVKVYLFSGGLQSVGGRGRRARGRTVTPENTENCQSCEASQRVWEVRNTRRLWLRSRSVERFMWPCFWSYKWNGGRLDAEYAGLYQHRTAWQLDAEKQLQNSSHPRKMPVVFCFL